MTLRTLICLLAVVLVPKMGSASIRGTAFNNWTFDCEAEVLKKMGQENPWAFNSELLNHAETAARKGLVAISEVNPELAKVILARWKSEKLTFRCMLESQDFQNVNAAAFFDGRNPLDMTIQILPGALKSRSEDEFRATLLHELLHFAGMDNVSASAHTYHPFHSGFFEIGLMEDVVYACTAQAYPIPRTLEVRASKENPRKGNLYSRSKKTCEVCARAQIQNRWQTLLRTDRTAAADAMIQCEYTQEVQLNFQPMLR